MSVSISNPALLRVILTGALVFAGTACSRSDRTQSGQDNSAAVSSDTSSSSSTQPAGVGTEMGAGSDTATAPAQPSPSSQPNTPRAETAPAGDKNAAGYRPMERDTTNASGQHSDSARVTADTTETSSAPGVADTSSTEMARDTSAVADQGDSVATANGDVALQASTDTSAQANADVSAEAGAAVADTTGNAGRIRPAEDSTPDSLEMARVRPPEDSTEILGNVTTNEAVDETADEQVMRPEDRETVAAETRTDEVGAAAIGGNLTGAEAVALMSREGVRCGVVDPETNEAVRWDMSSTPVALNPCGMGSMNLSRIWTAGRRDGGTAGQ